MRGKDELGVFFIEVLVVFGLLTLIWWLFCFQFNWSFSSSLEPMAWMMLGFTLSWLINIG
ncbi:hypothetical protein AKJ56_00390 [candidate division MSBL1 archaeon SCGC-AAA382N08]|uniref:Uncharacterized protein n=1 Tax=candidate division MSBL1 archaeon SCGC-AAA382N08 TaxID=1698285 RepID=A0A133VQN0_9EURY|nr:hypothetical protein AKJ56_00390 [candidate division MSBL1 archaeon SCGC-AAA382N08]